MEKIKQVIIVEGKHDIDFLSTFLHADFIKTDGTSLPNKTKDYIKTLSKTREFIILTDPDSPGEKIRKELQELIPNARHAFINVKKAKYKNKVGVEHTTKEEVLSALNNLIDFSNQSENLNTTDLFELGLLGNENSAKNRLILEEKLRIGHGSGKTFLKRLNLINMDKEKLTKLLKEMK